jgi:hypothetical protein
MKLSDRTPSSLRSIGHHLTKEIMPLLPLILQVSPPRPDTYLHIGKAGYRVLSVTSLKIQS